VSTFNWLNFAEAAIGAGVGTAVGAAVVFLIERHRREQDRKDRDIAATNVALHKLCAILNSTAQIQREIVKPARDSVARWYELRPFSTPPAVDIDTGSLSYLFSGNFRNVPNELMLEVDRYNTLRFTIDQLRLYHMEQAQPAIERMQFQGKASVESLKAACGPRLVGILSALTDSIVEFVDANVQSVNAAAERLRQGGQEAYGPGHFIYWIDPDKSEQPPPPLPWYRLKPSELRRPRWR